MQPFCSKVTASVGTSKVRFCNPSEMNTITLPSELSLPATNSWLTAGAGWSLAQLGSAAMLTRAGCGNWPWNFTRPTTEAPDPASGLAAGPAAPEASPLADAKLAAMTTDTNTARVESVCLIFMKVHSCDRPEGIRSGANTLNAGNLGRVADYKQLTSRS